MNRGRRRGGANSSLPSLRDGVKRRLFDPYIVPVAPDPRTVIGRLIPLSFTEPHIPSALPQLDSSSSHWKPEKASEKDFQLQMVSGIGYLKAVDSLQQKQL